MYMQIHKDNNVNTINVIIKMYINETNVYFYF